MKNLKMFKLFAAAAAALILSVPAFAHDHGAEGSCPHHQATETAVSQAITLLDQARSQSGDQARATLEQARQQLAEAQKHMSACKEMCETKMKDHGGHMDHSGPNITPGHPIHDHAPAGVESSKVTDPVCGMAVDPKNPGAKTVYAGKTYYFCSQADKEKFDRDPETYLKKQG